MTTTKNKKKNLLSPIALLQVEVNPVSLSMLLSCSPPRFASSFYKSRTNVIFVGINVNQSSEVRDKDKYGVNFDS